MRKALLCLVLGAAALPAFGGERTLLPPNPAYKAECGTCHVAFPPRLLPAEAWRRVMARLERHYGSDASLEPLTRDEIERFLLANAGSRPAPPGDAPRVTETAWFRKEHREVSPALWKSARVKSAANCAACHAGAETGIYEH